MDRQTILEQLKKDGNISVLIAGAGINGAGTFRDLALNGVNVLLVDRGDFCSGASAASSHMAHGGIRYLENGEFRLVREAVHERNRMIENAPHVVKPLPTTIPIFKFWSGLLNAPFKFLNLLDKPAERGAFVIKVGLILYDAFTHAQKTVPTHKFFGRAASMAATPHLNPEVKYTALYYDGQIRSPERYTVELVADAEAEGPHARALNYVSLAGFEDGQALLRDELTGQTIKVKPQLIVNAAGPWIDPVNQHLGLPSHYIGGTKGSHLVLDYPELRKAIGNNEFFFENKDGRIVLIFPFYDKVIIGTSDIPIEDADSARCTADEEQYFIDLVGRVFPDLPVKREQIVFRFSGVRPLEYMKAKTTGQISRDHTIREDSLGGIPVFSLVGGKWTSYRAFSEQVTDKALATMGKNRQAGTDTLPVGGGRDYPSTQAGQKAFIDMVAAENGLPRKRVVTLFDRYGTAAARIAAYLKAGKDAPLKSQSEYSRREVEYLVMHEKPVHVDDLLLRRSTLAWLGYATRPLVEEITDIMGDQLKWNKSQKESEVSRTVKELKDRHGVEMERI